MNKEMTVKEAGSKGGKSRAKRLSKERRKEIAKLGYAAGIGKKEKVKEAKESGQ